MVQECFPPYTAPELTALEFVSVITRESGGGEVGKREKRGGLAGVTNVRSKVSRGEVKDAIWKLAYHSANHTPHFAL